MTKTHLAFAIGEPFLESEAAMYLRVQRTTGLKVYSLRKLSFSHSNLLGEISKHGNTIADIALLFG